MRYIDIFNGDADGICALIQYRQHNPQNSTLVTGVKRDIQLLDAVLHNHAPLQADDQLAVFDISLDKNRDSLLKILATGANIFYVDHHFAGTIPEHNNLTTSINTASNVCTSLLINQHLQGQFVEWAIVGCFGDNLDHSAQTLSKSLSLLDRQLNQLQQLGIYMNYNGYGATIDDLYFPPAQLYQLLYPYANPFDFIEYSKEVLQQLEQGYQADISAAEHIQAEFNNHTVAVFILPNEPWARRVSGVYSNMLANRFPERAHAVLTCKANDHYLVSVRAPLDNKTGADVLCRRFQSGGGRAAAAGINDLPADQLGQFIDQFNQFYSSPNLS